jgi:hypothetical protein
MKKSTFLLFLGIGILLTNQVNGQTEYKRNRELEKEIPCYSYILSREGSTNYIFVNRIGWGMFEIISPQRLDQGKINEKDIQLYQKAGEKVYYLAEGYCGEVEAYNGNRFFYVFIGNPKNKTLEFKGTTLTFK